MIPSKSISVLIQQLVRQLPASVAINLARTLRDIEAIALPQSRIHILRTIVQSEAQVLVAEFIEIWLGSYSHLTGETMSVALECASEVEEYHRQSQAIDIVWTGPVIHEINFRKTESVLLELINSANHELQIVSFAVYRARSIIEALLQALERRVSISIFLETPQQGENKIAYDTKSALGSDLTKKAKIYGWAREKRQLSPDGAYGSLHAKLAIADKKSLFVSSANLTDYAMSLNIELGVLIQEPVLAAKVEKQLNLLIENRIFTLI